MVWGKLAVTAVGGQFLVCTLNCRLFASWNLCAQSMSSSWDKDAFREEFQHLLTWTKMNSALGILSTCIILLGKWLHNYSLFVDRLALNCNSKPLLSFYFYFSLPHRLRVYSIQTNLNYFCCRRFSKIMTTYFYTIWF